MYSTLSTSTLGYLVRSFDTGSTANRPRIERGGTRKELKFTGGSQIVNGEAQVLLRPPQLRFN